MTANQTEHDPVCHMDINIQDAAARSDFNGMTYYFCSRGCKLDFDEAPEAVLKAEAEHDHSKPAEHMMMSPAASSSMAQGEKKPWWKIW